MPALLAPCPGCARHVMRSERACPFCAAPLEGDPSSAHIDEEPSRISRSALLLAGAAMVAGCNLTSPSVAVYGAPSPPPAAASQDVPSMAAIYGAPPSSLVDAAMTPMPPPAPIYGLPPPLPAPPQVDASAPVDAHAAPRHHAPVPPRREHIPVPAYGVSPRHDPLFKP